MQRFRRAIWLLAAALIATALFPEIADAAGELQQQQALATGPTVRTVRTHDVTRTSPDGIGGRLVETFRELERQVQTWVAASYSRRPALTLASAALLTLPPLLLIGWMIGWRQRRVVEARAARAIVPDSATELLGRAPSIRDDAHIALLHPAPGRVALVRDLLRIGREDDNDLRVSEDGVERYHALIQRAATREFMLHDVSGPGGSGVVVNGIRIAVIRLKHGDLIEIGKTKVRFEAFAA